MNTEVENNFGLARLILAVTVIASHTPMLLTGDLASEPGLRLWGTLRLGQIAVAGFFLVSGYLIAQSFENTATFAGYLWKRIVRIYPAFIVAAALTVFVVAPIASVPFTEPAEIAQALAGALYLARPIAPGAFPGVGFGDLNAPMWTIAYEFRCYVLLGIIGSLGLLRSPRIIVTIAALLLGATATGRLGGTSVPYLGMVIGAPDAIIPLAGYFLTGTSFYLLRAKIVYSHAGAAAAIVLLFCAMFVRWLADPALALFGGYLIFWFAFKAPLLWASRRIKDDLSYDIYLYAWPIQSALIYYGLAKAEWSVTLLSTTGAATMALLSWRLIESPARRLKDRSRRSVPLKAS